MTSHWQLLSAHRHTWYICCIMVSQEYITPNDVCNPSYILGWLSADLQLCNLTFPLRSPSLAALRPSSYPSVDATSSPLVLSVSVVRWSKLKIVKNGRIYRCFAEFQSQRGSGPRTGVRSRAQVHEPVLHRRGSLRDGRVSKSHL